MALLYFTVMLPVFIGLALLAVDVSRVYILNSSLQHGADAIALAMAGELDRTSTAKTRAEAAAAGLVSNPATFTNTFAAVNGTSVTWRFLTSLPASDSTPIDATYVSTKSDASDAAFVEVTVNPASYNTIFPASFINGLNSVSTKATAVAGMSPGACNVEPMFICNPLEPTGNSDPYRITELLDHVNDKTKRRRLIMFKSFDSGAGQTTFSPGNFGYIDTAYGKKGGGARQLKDVISQAVPNTCVSQNNLTTQPGNITASADAFNVRFDMYGGNLNKNDADIRPARNVRKSYQPGSNGNGNGNGNTDACSPQVVTDTSVAIGLPRDTCLVAGNCTNPYGGGNFGGRLGGGDWNLQFSTYMSTNFTNAAQQPKDPATNQNFTSASLPTRYEVYRAEIDQNKIGNKSMATPACYNNTGTPPNDLPDRRLMFVAIANCIAQPIGSGKTTINAAAFGLIFLTEPVSTRGNQGDEDALYAELINVIKPGVGSGSNGAIIADNVQLYR